MSRKSVIISSSSILFLSLVAVLFSIIIAIVPLKVYAQANTTSSISNTPSLETVTTDTNTTGLADFKTLRDQYLAQWQQLNFQSGFDTFVEDGSVQEYGVYEERPSNIFNIDTRSIVLYVEPVGYVFKEGVDEEGNILYSFNFTAMITISDNHGNLLTEPISADFGEPLNSHNKVTEAFMPITLTLEQPLPVGQYTITYDITDGTSGKSFEIVKDIRVAEIIR